MESEEAGAHFTELVLLTFQLNGLWLEAGDRLTAPVGQSSARWQVMGCVDHEARSVAQIARIMGLARQSVQRTADLLVRDGLARYHDNPQHKRAKLLRLTEAGLSTLGTIETAQRAWASRLEQALGAAELEQLNSALARVLALARSADAALEPDPNLPETE